MKSPSVMLKRLFLYGETLQEFYVRLPKELQSPLEKEHNLVRKLHKALYGTPDAPKIWYRTLATYLSSIGFQKCAREHCLFLHPQTEVIIMVYVDDIAIGGPSRLLITAVVEKLRQKFSIRDMGPPKLFLGINIQHFPASKTIFISQQTYITKLVDTYGLQDAKPKATPMAHKTVLTPVHNEEEITDQPYRSLVGALLYISVCTRPDISFAVSILSKFV